MKEGEADLVPGAGHVVEAQLHSLASARRLSYPPW